MTFLQKLRATMRVIKQSPDDLVRAGLLRNGDNLSKIRTVDHFAIFKSVAQAEYYKEFVTSRGYTIVSATEPFFVDFTKESLVVGEQFDHEIRMLENYAVQLGGEYDGWGSPIVK